ncbi:MAG: DHH family phosphoesterase [Burkholderiales bacterium]
MRFYDIFNGDADGLCALHQLRLDQPREATLITGVKRDIRLLGQISPTSGDEVVVLDVSLDSNREALLQALAAGARVRYFDHHFAGEIPDHPLLEPHIDVSADTCTSLIVDQYLSGSHRMWAIVAAFGDNLPAQAYAVAAELGLGKGDIETLKDLGENLNYNAYGANLAELHFHPATLYLRMRPHADPLAFCAQAPELDTLRRARQDDLRRARDLPLENVGQHAVLVCLPEAAWSRRIIGSFANELARQYAKRTVALLLRSGSGYQVSLRAPEQGEAAIHLLAQQFESGSGRARAAGIAFLPDSEVARLRALLKKPASHSA